MTKLFYIVNNNLFFEIFNVASQFRLQNLDSQVRKYNTSITNESRSVVFRTSVSKVLLSSTSTATFYDLESQINSLLLISQYKILEHLRRIAKVVLESNFNNKENFVSLKFLFESRDIANASTNVEFDNKKSIASNVESNNKKNTTASVESNNRKSALSLSTKEQHSNLSI